MTDDVPLQCQATLQHKRAHSGRNKDPLIVPLSKPLGQSAGGKWVPRACLSRLARTWAAEKHEALSSVSDVQLSVFEDWIIYI